MSIADLFIVPESALVLELLEATVLEIYAILYLSFLVGVLQHLARSNWPLSTLQRREKI